MLISKSNLFKRLSIVVKPVEGRQEINNTTSAMSLEKSNQCALMAAQEATERYQKLQDLVINELTALKKIAQRKCKRGSFYCISS